MEDKMISTASQLSSDQAVAEGGGAEAELGGGVDVVGPASVELTENRRRGRPKKFNFVASPPPPPGFPSYEKRRRGRPRGSGRLQLLASLGGFLAETAGGSFIPHVFIVDAGEDIVRKLLCFAQKGRRAICILSATGCVSSAVIREPGSSAGILRYEGRFDILSLTGSFIFTGKYRKNGMLSVSLAKPDGKVFGGVVSGSLIAFAPIQLIVGSFKQDISKELKLIRQSVESSTAAYNDNGDSETEKTSTQIGSEDIDGGEENCNTQTSTVFESTNEQPHPISSQRKSSTLPQI